MDGPRILVVAPSWVGDAVLAQPMLARLRERFPDSRIDVLAPSWVGEAYARMPGVARVIPSPFGHGELALRARWRLARTLAAQGYARAWVLPNSLKSAIVPWLARIARRTGYVGEQRYGLLNDARRLDARALPRLVERFAALAEERGADLPPAHAPRLEPDRESRAQVLARLRLAESPPPVVLCPGAEYGPAKRWPVEHFAATARRVLAEGHPVWLVGSPNDAASSSAIAARAPGAVDLAGRTGLGEAIDLMSLARLVISNDSGLMHVAAALHRPLVAIFGSSSPSYTPPLAPNARVARLDLPCSPCFQRECPLGHTRCLVGLEPAIVLDLAREVLLETGRGPPEGPDRGLRNARAESRDAQGGAGPVAAVAPDVRSLRPGNPHDALSD